MLDRKESGGLDTDSERDGREGLAVPVPGNTVLFVDIDCSGTRVYRPNFSDSGRKILAHLLVDGVVEASLQIVGIVLARNYFDRNQERFGHKCIVNISLWWSGKHRDIGSRTVAFEPAESISPTRRRLR